MPAEGPSVSDWRPSVTGLVVGAAVGGVGRATVVALHLDGAGKAGIMVITLAAVVGALIGALAGLRGTPLVGLFIGAVLSGMMYFVSMPLALLFGVIGVGAPPSLIEVVSVGAISGLAAGVADRVYERRQMEGRHT